MKAKIAYLNELATAALKRYGYTGREVSVIREIIMYAQIRGNNQGLVKLIGKGIPRDQDAGPIRTVKETKLSAVLDGGKNFGMIVMTKATEIAVRKAKKHGFGIVGTRNTCTSTGAIGYYVRQMAGKDLIGFAFAGSPPTVAPYGSSEPVFGTNPLAIGIPAEPEPVVLDMATAAVAYYGLIEAKTAGRKIPEGIAYDKRGLPTADPAAAMGGAIKAFDGHKGSGLGFMVTAFTGPLVGAAFAGIGAIGDWGNLVMAIDPEILISPDEFRKNVTILAGRVSKAKKLPGVKDVCVPGEHGDRLTKDNIGKGSIEIENNLLAALEKAAGKPS